ncbi:TELO2-interacting protein 2 [Anguilla rostrata]|uniref:TELO2-interacting protein 2 n=1 Tax=Anguilla rostrata TaxID=7938 RepID=UPI0030D03F50
MYLSDSLHDLKIKEAAGDQQGHGQFSGNSVHEVHCWVQDCLRVAGSSAEQLDTVHSVKQLFESADSHLLFSECCANEGANIKKVYLEIVISLTHFAALPLCETESGDLPASSYVAVPGKSSAVCAVLLTLCRRLGPGSDVPCCHCPSSPLSPLARALAPPLFVFAVTHMQDQPWTSDSSRTAAALLLNAVVHGSGFASSSQLLCGNTVGDHTGILAAVLEILKPEVTKENWKRNQATKHVFAWTLTQVGRPWLAEFLDRVFPPSLLISDDYRTENKVLGVRCLHHIVLNVPAADLRQYNRAQVLYHALFNHLYVAEAELIEVVLPCLLDLLSVLEKPPGSAGMARNPNRYDEVLRLILTHMEMEHRLALRRVYARNVALFTDRMGIVTVRHLKRVERVILGYLEISDAPGEQARLSILDVLEKTIQQAWPRLECRLAVLVRALLKLLVDVSADRTSAPPAVREELLRKATHCLLLLDYCSQGKLKVLLKEVDSSCADGTVLECLKKVTDVS